jgi:hypothetical protein
MSTRANILMKDQYSKQWFYRHSDGYPSCTAESLKTFVKWLIDGKIRNNVSQGSPWLIILGNTETTEMIRDMNKTAKENPDDFGNRKYTKKDFGGGSKPAGGFMGWKVGSYEITDQRHMDICYLYTIDLEQKSVRVECYDGKGVTYSFEDFLNTSFEDDELFLERAS